jgi:signal transduction histidine kinase
MSKTSVGPLVEGLGVLVRLCDILGSQSEVEELYGAGLQAVHDIVKPDRAYVAMPDSTSIPATDKSGFTLELNYQGEELGFFVLHYDVPCKFSEEETLLIQTAASMTAAAVWHLGERKKLQEALNAAQQVQRLKDDFVSIVAHELQGPLMTVLGAVSILRTKSEHAPIGLLDMIERNARAQAKIISDLLDLARIESGKIELHRTDLDAVALLRQIVEEIQAGPASPKVTIQFTPPGDPIILYADTQRLRQTFWNLLSNSVRFASPAGKVHVEASVHDKFAEFRFQDNGVGIDPQFLPFVFDRFRQEHRAPPIFQEGLGLGLSIARQFVELHGGSVKAESPGVGKGATFSVRLPRALEFK